MAAPGEIFFAIVIFDYGFMVAYTHSFVIILLLIQVVIDLAPVLFHRNLV